MTKCLRKFNTVEGKRRITNYNRKLRKNKSITSVNSGNGDDEGLEKFG